MKPKEMEATLMDAVSHKEQVLMVGPPGIGKTDIITQVCEKLKADMIVSHPAVSDPTDYKGLPAKSACGNFADFLPFGDTRRAMQAKSLTVWFVDDLGQASEAVQKGLMQLLLGRRLNGHVLSNDVVFIGATNDIGHKAGVTGLIEPIKSRWDSIIKLEVDLDDWCDWALTHDMPPEVIAYLRHKPGQLSDFQPTKELTNSPCPRAWASIGRRVSRGVRNYELFAGCVGKGAATEFLSFLEMAEKAPDLKEIIKNPRKMPVPKEPALKYLVSSGLAHLAKKDNFENIYIYLERMDQPFRVLTMRDAITKDTQLAKTETFTKWASGEGKTII